MVSSGPPWTLPSGLVRLQTTALPLWSFWTSAWVTATDGNMPSGQPAVAATGPGTKTGAITAAAKNATKNRAFTLAPPVGRAGRGADAPTLPRFVTFDARIRG